MDKASTVFEKPAKAEKGTNREDERRRKESGQMLKTIGQLTLERDFSELLSPVRTDGNYSVNGLLQGETAVGLDRGDHYSDSK